MKKYFKPLDFLFYFNCVGIISWIILLFKQDDTFPTWLKIVLLTIILIKQLTYVKWENIFKNYN